MSQLIRSHIQLPIAHVCLFNGDGDGVRCLLNLLLKHMMETLLHAISNPVTCGLKVALGIQCNEEVRPRFFAEYR